MHDILDESKLPDDYTHEDLKDDMEKLASWQAELILEFGYSSTTEHLCRLLDYIVENGLVFRGKRIKIDEVRRLEYWSEQYGGRGIEAAEAEKKREEKRGNENE